jgi:type II secretory pathway component PulF
MPFLKYEALDRTGKVVNGSAEANSVNDLARLLQQRGFQPLTIDGQRFGSSKPPIKKTAGPDTQRTSSVIQTRVQIPTDSSGMATAIPPSRSSSSSQTVTSAPKVTDPVGISVMNQFFTFSQWADLTRTGMEQGQICHHFKNQGTQKASSKFFAGRNSTFSSLNMILMYLNPSMWLLFFFNYFFDRRGSMQQMYGEMEQAFYQGRSVSSEMDLRPTQYAPYIPPTIKIGEISGALPEAMDQIAETSKRAHTFTVMQMTLVTMLPFMIYIGSYGYAISNASRNAINRHIAGTVQALPNESMQDLGKRVLFEELSKQSPMVWKGFWIALCVSVFFGLIMIPTFRKTRHMLAMALPFAYGRAKAEAIERVTWALSKGMTAGLSAASIMHTAVSTIPNLWLRDRVLKSVGGVRENESIMDMLHRSNLLGHHYMSMLHTAHLTGTESRSLDQISTIENTTYERKTTFAFWSNRILITIVVLSIGVIVWYGMWGSYADSMSQMIQSTMNE